MGFKGQQPNMGNERDRHERRQYIRIKKNFIISYSVRESPEHKHTITQLKNIGMGGMCFIAPEHYAPSAKISIEFKTPHFADTLQVNAKVLESHMKVPGMIYETRVLFDELTAHAKEVLQRIAETFLNAT